MVPRWPQPVQCIHMVLLLSAGTPSQASPPTAAPSKAPSEAPSHAPTGTPSSNNDCVIGTKAYERCLRDDISDWAKQGPDQSVLQHLVGTAPCSLAASGVAGCMSIGKAPGRDSEYRRFEKKDTGVQSQQSNVLSFLVYSEYMHFSWDQNSASSQHGICMMQVIHNTGTVYFHQMMVTENDLWLQMGGTNKVKLCDNCMAGSQWTWVEILFDAPAVDRFRVCVNGVQQGGDQNVIYTGFDGWEHVKLGNARGDTSCQYLSVAWGIRSDRNCARCSANPMNPCGWQPPGPPSASPSVQPTPFPSAAPSAPPSTAQPSGAPTVPPTAPPTVSAPSVTPTVSPTDTPFLKPSTPPSLSPSAAPSAPPQQAPTAAPSLVPSASPSAPPTTAPSSVPSRPPSLSPSSPPSGAPSANPSLAPSSAPSEPPSVPPSAPPSTPPTLGPSAVPSLPPSQGPSSPPTTAPTLSPSLRPTSPPSSPPSPRPSAAPSERPSPRPSGSPSEQPSPFPSSPPSAAPTARPSAAPTARPSVRPTRTPTTPPTAQPSGGPSAPPTPAPHAPPSAAPSTAPTASPTAASPTAAPSLAPTVQPSRLPTASPWVQPSADDGLGTARDVAAANAVTALAAGSALSGAQAGRLIALAKGCASGVSDDVPWTLHVTQLTIGGGPLPRHSGCVVFSLATVAVLAVLQFAAAGTAAVVLKRPQLAAQAMVRCPGATIAAAVLLLQGPTFCGARLLRHNSGDAAAIIIGIVGCLIGIASPVVLQRSGSTAARMSVFKRDNQIRSSWQKQWLGSSEWVSLGEDGAVERLGPAFKVAKPRLHVYLAADLAVTLITMFGNGFGGGSCASCAAGRFVDGTLGLLFCFAILRARPYVRPFRLPMTLVAQGLLAGGAVALGAGYASPECGSSSGTLPGHEVAGALLVASGVASIGITLANIGATLQNIRSKRRTRLREPVDAVWEATGGRWIAPAALAPVMAKHLHCQLSDAEAEKLAAALGSGLSGVPIKELLEAEGKLWRGAAKAVDSSGVMEMLLRMDTHPSGQIVSPDHPCTPGADPMACSVRSSGTAQEAEGHRSPRRGHRRRRRRAMLTVTGAGASAVNGVYEQAGSLVDSAPQLADSMAGSQPSLTRWTSQRGNAVIAENASGVWEMGTECAESMRRSASAATACSLSGSVFYLNRSGIGSTAGLSGAVPIEGWEVGPQGVPPLPSISVGAGGGVTPVTISVQDTSSRPTRRLPRTTSGTGGRSAPPLSPRSFREGSRSPPDTDWRVYGGRHQAPTSPMQPARRAGQDGRSHFGRSKTRLGSSQLPPSVASSSIPAELQASRRTLAASHAAAVIGGSSVRSRH
eukprot:TRINITY_DN10630_c0_g1_i1.p1 TRINITY_DN10630_c0_g1~~TRINITY_DN10630_c0_g1_i1.p1  ORF type:complete len:1339 (+),score=186.01 TRINITY_DN10630_c0_g1_i1:77-4093(+)